VGAEVWTKGQFLATTPTTLTLRRKSDYDIEIKKEGFEVAQVRLESRSEHDASSILLGGPIGWGLDVSTGGNKRLYPESVHVVLRALPRAQLEALKAKGTITEEAYTVVARGAGGGVVTPLRLQVGRIAERAGADVRQKTSEDVIKLQALLIAHDADEHQQHRDHERY
jgi:hypothetical protein